MLTRFVLAGFLSLVSVLTASGQSQQSVQRRDPEQIPGEWNEDKFRGEMRSRFEWLVNDAGFPTDCPGIVAVLTPEKEAELYVDNSDCESCDKDGENRVGVNISTDATVSLHQISDDALKSGSKLVGPGVVKRLPDGRVAWTTRIESPGAGGLRIHFKDFSLPSGFKMYFYTESGEVFGPYAQNGPMDNGEFWSNCATGSIGYLALISDSNADGQAMKSTHFDIHEIAYLRPEFDMPVSYQGQNEGKMLLCTFDASCFNTNDWADIEGVRSAIAMMIYPTPEGQSRCTGSLIVDAVPTTYAPYFLTANHCIKDQSAATGLECVWKFKTSSCGVGFSDFASIVGFPRTLGSTLLSTQSTNDHTLLVLAEDPPLGSWSLGWDANNVPIGTGLYRMHHPRGAQQSLSLHFTHLPYTLCTWASDSNFLCSYDLLGGTDSGSSGSPVILEGGYVVGQLAGRCLNTLTCFSECDSGCVDRFDGRFSVTYNYVIPWLDSTLRIKAPNGGGTWTRGQKYQIKWTWTGMPGAYVRLELWRNGQFVRVIKASTPNDGKQRYKLPTNLIAGSGYKVRVVSVFNTYILDDSNGSFAVN